MSQHEWVEHDGAYHCFACGETRYSDVNLDSGDCLRGKTQGAPAPCPSCAALQAEVTNLSAQLEAVRGNYDREHTELVACREIGPYPLAVSQRIDALVRGQESYPQAVAARDAARQEVARLTGLVEKAWQDGRQSGLRGYEAIGCVGREWLAFQQREGLVLGESRDD